MMTLRPAQFRALRLAIRLQTYPQPHLTRSGASGVISWVCLSLYHLLIKAAVYTFMDFLQSPVSPSPWAQCRQITASLSRVRHLSSGYNSHGETENSVTISSLQCRSTHAKNNDTNKGSRDASEVKDHMFVLPSFAMIFSFSSSNIHFKPVATSIP